jgi:hypothetical protein
MDENIIIPKDLFVAINNVFSGSEAKVLLTLLGYKNEQMSTKNILEIAGITQANNYFRTRKQLVDLDYLIVDNEGMHVNTDKILSDYPLDK